MNWSFFKKKHTDPIQRDYGLFDVHSHLIWGVDDGAQSIEDTADFLGAYSRLGYRGVVATPHINHRMFETPERDLLAQRLDELSPFMARLKVNVKVAGEVMCRGDFLEGFETDRFPGIGSAWLIEFENRPGVFTQALERMVFEFQIAGRTLILAHPERYADIQRNREMAHLLKQRGMILQINLGSLTGRYGAGAQRLAWEMVENGLADIAGTDAHRASDFVLIEKALDELERFDPRRFRTLVSINPEHIFLGHAECVN